MKPNVARAKASAAVMTAFALCSATGCGLTATSATSWLAFEPAAPDPATAQMRQLTEGEKAEVCLATAKSLAEGGAEGAAIEQYERARKFGGDSDGAIGRRLAVLYDRQGKTREAEREYTAAIERSPDDPDVLCDYGYFLYSRGDLPAAEERLRRAVETSPKHEKATLNLAMCLAEQKRYSEAEPLFEQAVGKAAAQHNLGMILAKHGQLDESRRRLALASQLDPNLRSSESALRLLDERTQVASGHVTSPALR